VQIDVIDGAYAPTTSWPYGGVEQEAFEAIRRKTDGLPYWQDFDFEIDMMVVKPEERIDDWALAGAACLIIHMESTEKLEEIFVAAHERRLEVALALKPSTDHAVLEPFVERAVFVQVMGSDRIGYHGVSLDRRALEKIQAIHKEWPELEIGVDIGVSETTLPELVAAGARRFAAGSAVFASGDTHGAYKALEDLAEELVANTSKS